MKLREAVRFASRSGRAPLGAALVALGLSLGGVANAGAPPPTAPEKAQKRQFNFSGDTISTDFLKPGTMLIEGVSRGRRSSLIEVRLDFVNEILRSADDI
jgi:hypothetical protein